MASAVSATTALTCIPAILSLVSIAILSFGAAFSLAGSLRVYSSSNSVSEDEFRKIRVPERSDGSLVVAYKVLRFFSTLAVLSIGLYQLSTEGFAPWWLIFTYSYCSLLAILSLASTQKWRDRAETHLTILLLVTFLVFFRLFVLPVLQITEEEKDGISTRVSGAAWATVYLLSFGGVVYPLTVPYVFRPKSLDDIPCPEETISLLSRGTYIFVDRIIFFAARATDVKVTDLPVLGTRDRALTLYSKAASHIDPANKKRPRHVFWYILRYFAWDALAAFLCYCANGLLQFLPPFALKSLLAYLEGQPSSTLKPWVWILGIALGPLIQSIFNNQFYYFYLRSFIQQESVLNQIIFEHALRMRVSSEEKAKPSSDGKTQHDEDDARSSRSASSSTATGVSTTTAKGLAKQSGKTGDKAAPLTGKINNLISSDMTTMCQAPLILSVPAAILQFCLSMVFLYSLLGWSAFLALAVFVVALPVPTYLAKLTMGAQKEKMKRTDKRVQAVTETMGVLRMIKLFAWEPRMLKALNDKREDELKYVFKGKILDMLMFSVDMTIPILASVLTLGAYTLIMKKPLVPSLAFSAIAVFDILRSNINYISHYVPQALRAKISYDRLNEYLTTTDLLDPETALDTAQEPKPIGFNAASFSWRNEDNDGTSTPSQRTFNLCSEQPVTFKTGKISIVIGPTGSGKTSMLMALLGEMHYRPQGPGSWASLPRKGGIAFAAQESWVLNDTIRNNILFGQAMSQDRYQKVLKRCGLERDIELWEAGDLTEIGEKGVTLSGGQKARVTLARALYSQARTLLLDDMLAALDVHTAKRVVDEAFRGDLVSGRTIILITHNLALAAPIAAHVVQLSKDGQVIAQGTVSEVLKMDVALQEEIKKEQAEVEKAEQVIEDIAGEETKKKAGKLVVKEEKAIGRVSLDSFLLFTRALGGPFWWCLFITFMVGSVFVNIGENAFLAYWSAQYQYKSPSVAYTALYVGIYGLLNFSDIVVYCAAQVLYCYASLRASRIIHLRLMQSVFGAPLRWLDVVPVGRITTRCTQDLQSIDARLPVLLSNFMRLSLGLLINYGTTVFMTGWAALLSGAFVFATSAWLGRVYLRAQLSVRREMSNAKAPIMSQFGSALGGLVSIRAYGAQNMFLSELRKRIDTMQRSASTYYHLNRWMAIRMETLGGLFAGVVTTYLVYGNGVGPALVGFTLNIVVSFTRRILYWVRIYNMFEVEANSLERLSDFIRIDQEPKPVEEFKPPAYWPATGNIRAEDLSAQYADDAPIVLKGLSFDIQSGQRVGVVGRTGAGKSSLALALLRAIKTAGKVYFDGRPTDTINLDALRSSITVIPQQPELLPGTIRDNLDPVGQHDDAALNDVLRAAGLFDLQGEEPTAADDSSTSTQTRVEDDRHKITLDSEVKSSGFNFSVGQRQIVALARAMLRRSKLLILDEATAAIDYQTDAAIQRFLRTELDKDTTVITIAHRLQTIMDSDKIMVLDAGELVEFDTPRNLLQQEHGYFKSLVDESNDKEALIQLAGMTGTMSK